MRPLAIIQARVHSTRLPNKMLLAVGLQPLIAWAWQATEAAFLLGDVVLACPDADGDAFHATLPEATIFRFTGDEHDVLGRFHACAHRHRTDPESVIYRITPDDWPIDVYRERCTLAQLDWWHEHIHDRETREHIGYLFPPRREINTAADLEAVRRQCVEQFQR
jgi:hypothetical protein